MRSRRRSWRSGLLVRLGRAGRRPRCASRGLGDLLDARVHVAELGLDRAQLLAQDSARAGRGVISSLACDWISACMVETSSSRFSSASTLRRRAIGSATSSTSCASDRRSFRFEATRSASRPGSSTLAVIESTSGGRFLSGSSSSTRPRTARISASLSTHQPALGVGRESALTCAQSAGSFSTKVSMRAFASPCTQHLHAAVGQAQDAHHHRHRADLVQVVGLGLLDLGVALRGEQQQPVAGERVLDRGDRALSRQEERQHHVREHHELPQREDRHLFRHLEVGGRRLGHCLAFSSRAERRLEAQSAGTAAHDALALLHGGR